MDPTPQSPDPLKIRLPQQKVGLEAGRKCHFLLESQHWKNCPVDRNVVEDEILNQQEEISLVGMRPVGEQFASRLKLVAGLVGV